MKTGEKIIIKFLEGGTLVAATGLILTVILQIVSRRFFTENAPSWTEEASRFFFVYAISFAAGLAQKEGYFVSMDYFYRRFNLRVKMIIDLMITVISMFLFGLMLIFSIQFILLGTVETSPGLELPMSIAFTSMFIMSGSVFYFLFSGLINFSRNMKK
jgi:TRAP-type C4-dicarboxylate transport system permease small subunit